MASDCHIKTCRSLKGIAILKIPLVPFFKKNLCISVGFKIKSLRKCLKTNTYFAVNLAEILNEATIQI